MTTPPTGALRVTVTSPERLRCPHCWTRMLRDEARDSWSCPGCRYVRRRAEVINAGRWRRRWWRLTRLVVFRRRSAILRKRDVGPELRPPRRRSVPSRELNREPLARKLNVDARSFPHDLGGRHG